MEKVKLNEYIGVNGDRRDYKRVPDALDRKVAKFVMISMCSSWHLIPNIMII